MRRPALWRRPMGVARRRGGKPSPSEPVKSKEGRREAAGQALTLPSEAHNCPTAAKAGSGSAQEAEMKSSEKLEELEDVDDPAASNSDSTGDAGGRPSSPLADAGSASRRDGQSRRR